jgi:acetyl-CoA C-acetyltransferase
VQQQVYIVDGLRTPRGRGKSDGSLAGVSALELAAFPLRELANRSKLTNLSNSIDDVILGCVTQTGEQGGCIGKMAALDAGLPESVPGFTLNRFCGSGLEAINLGMAKILAGQGQAIMAGGVESMSRTKMGSDQGAWMMDQDFIQRKSLVPQGISADLIATLDGFTRQQVDQFACDSQAKAARAREEGRFKSMVPFKDRNGKVLLDHDEHNRPDTSVEKLSALNASFEKVAAMGFDQLVYKKYPQVKKLTHVHHAGNSSGIVDGAAAVLIANQDFVTKTGLKPRGRILSGVTISCDPTIMLTGPAPASKLALARAGLSINQMDVVEVNEAFASVVMHFIRETGVDPRKVNPNGGAIALGHPLGATGAMLLLTALDELERTKGRYGLITLCIGGGMGIATVIERLG